MPQSVINAGDVQRAFTVPLEGLGAGLQYYDQLALHKQNRDLALKQQQKEEDYRKAQLLEKEFAGLDIGTGTPWDEVGQAQVATARKNLVDYMRANPGASATDLWAITNDQTKGILSGLDNAKKAKIYADNLAATVNKEYPYLDQTRLQTHFYNKVFKDDQGNVLPAPNLSYGAQELQDPAFRAQVINPMAADMALSKEMQEGFKPVPWQERDPNNPLILVHGETRPYLDRQGDPLTSPVNYGRPIPNVRVVPPSVLYGGAPAGPFPTTPAMDNVQLQGVPSEVLSQLKSKPVFHDMLIAERSRLKKDYKDELQGASEDQIDQLAALNLVKNYGSKAGIKLPDVNTKLADYVSKQAHQAFNEQATIHNQKNSDERLRIEKAKFTRQQQVDKAKAEENAVSPLTILTQYDNGTLAQNPKGAQLAQTQTVQMPTRDMGTLPMLQVHGIRGTPYLKDPGTGLDVKVYAFTDPRVYPKGDPRNGRKGFVVDEYRTPNDKEKAAGANPKSRIPVRRKYIYGQEKNMFFTGVANQLELNKPKQTLYNQTVDLADEIIPEEEN